MSKKVCNKKEAFSKQEAEEMIIKRYIAKGYAGNKYRCDNCGWWHLTKRLNNE